MRTIAAHVLVATPKNHRCVRVNLNPSHFISLTVAPPPVAVDDASDSDVHTSPSRVFQVCGSPDIPLHLLKSVATYKGVEPTAPLIQWFWEVMESFSNTERSLFLRFVWGRTRLPRTIADFRGRDFVVQVSVS